MSKIFWIVCIIIFSIAIRYMFTLYVPTYQVSGDTVSYYLTGKNIIETGVIVDPWRTPIYPLLIITPFVLSSNPLPEEFPMTIFSQSLWVVRIAQSISAVSMLVLLFFITQFLVKSNTIAGSICLLVSCSWPLLVNEFGLYTEAFATLWLVLTIGIYLLLLRKFSIGLFCSFIIMCIVGTLLRPFYILLPCVFLGILPWYYRSKHVWIWTAYGVIMYVACIGFYIQANGILHKYYGMSRISDINFIGKLFEYELPLSTHANDTDIRQIVERFQKTNTTRDPWYIFIQNPVLYRDVYAQKIHQFAIHSIVQNPVLYIYKSLEDIPLALSDTVEIPEKIYRTTVHKKLFELLSKFSAGMQRLYFLVFIALPIYLWDAYKKKSAKSTLLCTIAITCCYQILMSVFGSYDEFARLLSIMVPLIYIIIFDLLYRLYTQYRRFL